MKLTPLFFSLIFITSLYSDQLQWLTLEQAKKTIEYLNENDVKEVVLWCACCDNDVKQKVVVEKFYYRQTENPAYYEIVIEGTSTGAPLNKAVDLAYVHVKRGSKWRCLGKELKFECNPCTKPFKF
ncbi:MAG: hypothetical protein N2510_05900 [Ignavibacteria bacterium]|nr:hypothetical protein [Ignavibacteria bacterium]